MTEILKNQAISTSTVKVAIVVAKKAVVNTLK
jgi:hypothetical protein